MIVSFSGCRKKTTLILYHAARRYVNHPKRHLRAFLQANSQSKCSGAISKLHSDQRESRNETRSPPDRPQDPSGCQWDSANQKPIFAQKSLCQALFHAFFARFIVSVPFFHFFLTPRNRLSGEYADISAAAAFASFFDFCKNTIAILHNPPRAKTPFSECSPKNPVSLRRSDPSPAYRAGSDTARFLSLILANPESVCYNKSSNEPKHASSRFSGFQPSSLCRTEPVREVAQVMIGKTAPAAASQKRQIVRADLGRVPPCIPDRTARFVRCKYTGMKGQTDDFR